MEVLTLDGKRYVKASKVARDLGYASDYVGQLCRSGAVDAHLVGRSWYVNPDTVGAHRIEKKRNARVKAREHAKRSIEQAKSLKVVNESANSYKNIDIRYENDKNELIPAVRRISVKSQLHPVEHTEEPEANYIIENRNEKIIMSGSLTVTDAEVEEQYTDTTVLTPKIDRKAHRQAKESARPKEEELSDESSASLTFAERILALEEETQGESSVEDVNDPTEIPEEEKKEQRSTLAYIAIFICIVIILVSSASLFAAKKFTFMEGNMDATFEIETSSVFELFN